MPSDAEIRTAAAHARLCLEAGDAVGALAQLERALPDLDSARAGPSAAVAEAAVLYASVLLAAGDAMSAGAWAEIGFREYRSRSGVASAEAMRAGSVLGRALAETGDHQRAVDVYASVVRLLPRHLGADHRQVFNGRADYAAALHLLGRCASARRVLGEACRAHLAVFGPADRDGIRMVARLAAMVRDCGDPHGSRAHFAQAHDRCVAHLGADDPLSSAIERLAAEAADGTHQCRSEAPAALIKATFGRRQRWQAS